MNNLITAILCGTVLCSSVSIALPCKERDASTFSLDEIAHHDHVVILSLEEVHGQDDPGRHSQVSRFRGRVIRSYKGGLNPGATITGEPGNEPAHAICPVRLELGKTYLLMLDGDEMPLTISRYTIRVTSESKYFDTIIEQLEGWVDSGRGELSNN